MATVVALCVRPASPSLFAQPNAQLTNAETTRTEPTSQKKQDSASSARKSSKEYVRLAWEASGKNDLKKVIQLTNECVEIYGLEARQQQSGLTDFPSRGREKDYQELNDTATCLFIQAEALMNNGKGEEAKAAFSKIIDQYKYAQAWDPSRGNFWSVAEKSQDSIDVLTGVRSEEAEKIDPHSLRSVPQPILKGTEEIVDYRKYGKFYAVGTKDYTYEVTDPQGLSRAVGEGIYPNNGSILNNPRFKKAKAEGRLEGSHWNFVHTEDLEAAYFKWITAPEPQGVKLFYLGMIFEKAKMYDEAIKAYHALIVHFPKSVGWTYWHTPWYPAQAAISKIKHIIHQHPELKLKYENARITVMYGFDNDVSNDMVVTDPGVISHKSLLDISKEKVTSATHNARLGPVKKRLGTGRVRLAQYKNQHWQLLVDNKPFLIKGITYSPTKVGQSPDKGTLTPWMESDVNGNGILDGPYESWVDANRNNEQDSDEPVVGDFQLMKDIGVNCLRIYHQPFEPKKEVLRQMYEKFGFMVVLGDYLGKYTFGSGASWYEGTNYENPEHRKNMMESVKKMVLDFKDEPYILIWLLGNENNYGVASNADKKPQAYFQFVNEVARMIKAIDPNHPVAVCNGDTLFLDVFAKAAPDVDIFAANAYRGDYGFGSFWEQVADATHKPAFISEYGAPAYVKYLSLAEGEEAQAAYHEGNWNDIQENSVGYSQGVGNALGGVVFEWTDEWWKNYEPFFHDKKSDAVGPFPGGYYYEEWFGITGQGNGQHSPLLRQLRTAYYRYQQMWK